MAAFIALVFWYHVARLVVILALIACDYFPVEKVLSIRFAVWHITASLVWIALAVSVLVGAI